MPSSTAASTIKRSGTSETGIRLSSSRRPMRLLPVVAHEEVHAARGVSCVGGRVDDPPIRAVCVPLHGRETGALGAHDPAGVLPVLAREDVALLRSAVDLPVPLSPAGDVLYRGGVAPRDLPVLVPGLVEGPGDEIGAPELGAEPEVLAVDVDVAARRRL